MTLQGQGYEVLGVVLAGPAPVVTTWLDLEPGVTALYGLNGAGKTRMLDAIREACTAKRIDGPEAARQLIVKVTEPDLPPNKAYWVADVLGAMAEGFRGATVSGPSLRADSEFSSWP